MLETKKGQLTVSCNIYDHRPDGVIYLITLKNRDLSVSVTNFGCIITAICTPDKNGSHKNIVAGYAELTDYRQNTHYFGCLLGRYANRISGAKFQMGQRTYKLSQNDGCDHLHGGFEGFNQKTFNVAALIQEDHEVGVEFEYLSKDGEEGYPGNLQVKVRYTLNDQNQLVMKYEATTDQPTPVNMANHSYFNLTGFETSDILEHNLQINSGYYTENEGDIPNGNILPLDGTTFDFKFPRSIGLHRDQFSSEHGYNQNYILPEHAAGEVILAAKLDEQLSGRTLAVYTDQPGIQLYTANEWDGEICGAQGKYYQQYGAVALETQNFPDSPNHPNFPNAILNPGETYHTTTIYEFGVE
ncbi:MAG TPA: aldose epimerase family protein [Mucilaginibacter sp.]|nr:aldose epimerase family protein [Mucilaginibacter sp.]